MPHPRLINIHCLSGDIRNLRHRSLQEEQDAELRYLEENSSAFEEQDANTEAAPLQEVCSALLKGSAFLKPPAFARSDMNCAYVPG